MTAPADDAHVVPNLHLPVSEQEERASYEVVELARLPDDGIAHDVPGHPGSCGCWHCEGDWPAIAAAAVDYLEAGGDPLDGYVALAKAHLPRQADRAWLLSLFVDPIICGRDDERFTNGRHRVHASDWPASNAASSTRRLASSKRAAGQREAAASSPASSSERQ